VGSTIARAPDAREALTLLAALPDSQRRYLTLLVAGYRYAEITELLGVTHTNVNKHLVRARASLRQQRFDCR
jgi:DNA-directed RNA polymerase specialized sigma24 family protein